MRPVFMPSGWPLGLGVVGPSVGRLFLSIRAQSKDRPQGMAPPRWAAGVFLGVVAAWSLDPAGGSRGDVGLLMLRAWTLNTQTFPGSSFVQL